MPVRARRLGVFDIAATIARCRPRQRREIGRIVPISAIADHVVIVDGAARAIDRPAPALAEAIAQAYRGKYTALGYAPAADSWDNGGLFEITPHTVIAWTQFTENPTKFVLCLLYTSDAADERSSVDLGGRRILKKQKNEH